MGITIDDPIVFFDGVCNLCNGAVQFLLRHDRHKRLRFAPLQGETARKMLIGLETGDGQVENSFILLEAGKVYSRSTAALRTCRYLSWFWRMAYGMIIIPRFIRDGVYNFVARHRYRWFGKRDSCMIPTPELRARFLP